jgi:hypothetical protein
MPITLVPFTQINSKPSIFRKNCMSRYCPWKHMLSSHIHPVSYWSAPPEEKGRADRKQIPWTINADLPWSGSLSDTRTDPGQDAPGFPE